MKKRLETASEEEDLQKEGNDEKNQGLILSRNRFVKKYDLTFPECLDIEHLNTAQIRALHDLLYWKNYYQNDPARPRPIVQSDIWQPEQMSALQSIMEAQPKKQTDEQAEFERRVTTDEPTDTSNTPNATVTVAPRSPQEDKLLSRLRKNPASLIVTTAAGVLAIVGGSFFIGTQANSKEVQNKPHAAGSLDGHLSSGLDKLKESYARVFKQAYASVSDVLDPSIRQAAIQKQSISLDKTKQEMEEYEREKILRHSSADYSTLRKLLHDIVENYGDENRQLSPGNPPYFDEITHLITHALKDAQQKINDYLNEGDFDGAMAEIDNAYNLIFEGSAAGIPGLPSDIENAKAKAHAYKELIRRAQEKIDVLPSDISIKLAKQIEETYEPKLKNLEARIDEFEKSQRYASAGM